MFSFILSNYRNGEAGGQGIGCRDTFGLLLIVAKYMEPTRPHLQLSETWRKIHFLPPLTECLTLPEDRMASKLASFALILCRISVNYKERTT